MEEGNRKEVAHPINNSDVPQEDEYSIANYLRDHHTLLIAIFSAIVAIFSFVINIVNYLNVNTYLKYWDIEISQVKFNSSNQIYSVFTAFFFQFIILFATWFISNTYDSYEKRLEKILYTKWKQKTTNKLIKEAYKEFRLTGKDLKRIKRISGNLIRVQEIEKTLDYVKNGLSQNRQEAREIRKEMRKLIGQEMLLLLMSNIISFFIVFGGCLILFSTLIYFDNALYYSLLFGIVYVVINVLIYGGINYFYARRKINKGVGKEEVEEVIYKDLPIEKVFFGKWNFILSNKSLKSIFIQLIVLTILFIFSFSYAGYSEAKEQREFQYVTSKDETYVVIYNNSEDLVIKKAFIDTDNIVIDLSEQKTISAKDVTLHKRKFSSVEILRVQ